MSLYTVGVTCPNADGTEQFSLVNAEWRFPDMIAHDYAQRWNDQYNREPIFRHYEVFNVNDQQVKDLLR